MEEDKKVYTYLVSAGELFSLIDRIGAHQMGFDNNQSKIEIAQRIFKNDDLVNDVAKDLFDLGIKEKVKEEKYTVACISDYYKDINKEKSKIIDKWANILWKPFDGVSPEGYKTDATHQPS